MATRVFIKHFPPGSLARVWGDKGEHFEGEELGAWTGCLPRVETPSPEPCQRVRVPPRGKAGEKGSSGEVVVGCGRGQRQRGGMAERRVCPPTWACGAQLEVRLGFCTLCFFNLISQCGSLVSLDKEDAASGRGLSSYLPRVVPEESKAFPSGAADLLPHRAPVFTAWVCLPSRG